MVHKTFLYMFCPWNSVADFDTGFILLSSNKTELNTSDLEVLIFGVWGWKEDTLVRSISVVVLFNLVSYSLGGGRDGGGPGGPGGARAGGGPGRGRAMGGGAREGGVITGDGAVRGPLDGGFVRGTELETSGSCSADEGAEDEWGLGGVAL